MSAKAKIVLIDDDPGLLRLLTLRLQAAGYEVDAVSNGTKALGRLAAFNPHLVITDLRMDGLDGMAVFEAVRAFNSALPVIIMTAHGTIHEAVEATQRGVFGYLAKPFASQALLTLVDQALRLGGAGEIGDGGDNQTWRADIISRSPVMEEVLAKAHLVAGSEASVLIQGESGTGKELIAKAIHKASSRCLKPFIAVNCSAIPEQLFESELFGHSKGSFTGAVQNYKGLFQAAQGGTLFLDEIGDMPIAFQAKLLRVLQEKEVRAVGTTQSIPIDVRIISATHRDLDIALAEGQFREDLYYRLHVVRMDLPPLRERREDISLLTQGFLAKLQSPTTRKISAFAPDAMELLIAAPWPGNVRQLWNVVEQSVALCTTPVIPATLVRMALRDKPADMMPLADARDQFERDYLVQLLRITAGNVSQAAKMAQRNRTEFYKLLHRFDLDPTQFRSTE